MRRVITRSRCIVAAAVLVAMSAAVPAYCSGLLFGVRPGQIVQSAYFGTNLGSLVPIVGLDFLSLSVSAEGTDFSASVYVPHVGVRMYFGPQIAPGVVRPYVEAGFLHAFASADLGSSELNKMVKDILGFWGVSATFGAEYFFSERFSVNGEYGLRYIKDSAKVDLAATDVTDAIDAKLDASFKASYVGVGLNFHF